MSEVQIAMGSLIIAALSLVATFIAPRLIGGARIFVETIDLSRIDSKSPAEDVSIRVFHGDEAIDQPVGMWTILLENTGTKDITATDFIDPVLIRLPAPCEALTATLESPEGVGGSWAKRDGQALEISWSILKPREVIRLKIIAAMPEPFEHRAMWNRVNWLVRLRDVRIGAGYRRYWWGGFAAAVFAATFALTAAAVAAIKVIPSERWVFNERGREWALVDEDSFYIGDLGAPKSRLRICPLKEPALVGLSGCRDSTPQAAASAVRSASRREVRLQIGVGDAGFVLGFSSVIAALMTACLEAMARFLRRTQKRWLLTVFEGEN